MRKEAGVIRIKIEKRRVEAINGTENLSMC